MKKLIPLALVILISVSFSCQKGTKKTTTSEVVTEVKNDIERIEPPHWWTGFNNTQVQLLVKHPNISEATPSINYAGVSIEKVHKADSPNYLFLDLNILESTKAGPFNIHFKFNEEKELVQTYEVKARLKEAADYQGFDSTDAIYLITPDRFANGDTSNDIKEDLKEKTINRKDDYARHGGDLRGIIQHLDYIQEMGFTQIWSCPLLTNDMERSSYHGYAMTDFYQVDPRYGSLEEYQELAAKAKEKGIGLIMDQVANHCGSEHWWMPDLPFKDWVNQQDSFENNKPLNNSNHRRTSNQDLYAAKRDKKEMAEGWFVPTMPDLNQRNPFMANYIIQNSIWWVETLNLSGIRQDTYPYPDKTFMSNWAGTIMNEYPNFSIVGEEWSTNPLLIAYWQEGHDNKDGYDSNLRSTMDFAMQKNTVDALNEAEKWDTGLVKIYEGLANDFAYASPKDIMAFPDNHDMSRIFTQLKGDVPNTKMALSYLLTLPRIPQLYYGTEILMNDFEKPGDHGLIRTDFPGGWQGDAINAFSGEGLADAQKDMQLFLKKVLNYRKSSDAIHNGKTIHFAPFMGTYFLFRVIEGETVVHIINKNNEPITLDLKRFEEVGLQGKTLKNIVTNETFVWEDEIILNERGSLLLSTKL
ncbi:glycoside hydrolase family 13 protein [Olleya sp. UBA1516]|uniref:glycoside hydrolase family 13 protein n=1 Tax=Olleya sp. UBA1516 TaxID=1947013 RepID=UPI0025CD1F25|nr:glycoside hydrolase family 13 protein [Olleya sp. UBA1516]|tara:strand:+ start:380 stop:2299 length:1920 start_codon:yes stop_codon:yes gene_type:complete